MKNKILFTVCCMAAFVFSAQAKVWTVSNNAYSPGQYTNLQHAIDSASAGDSIYVEPSAFSYGGITIGKQLYLFGGGGSPYTYQYNFRTTVDNITIQNHTTFPVTSPDGLII